MEENKGLEDVISLITEVLVIFSKATTGKRSLIKSIIDINKLKKTIKEISINKFSSNFITYDLFSDLIILIDFSDCLDTLTNITISNKNITQYSKQMVVKGDGVVVTCKRIFSNTIYLDFHDRLKGVSYDFTFMVDHEFITDPNNENYTDQDYYKKIIMFHLYKYALLPYLEHTIPSTKKIIKKYCENRKKNKRRNR